MIKEIQIKLLKLFMNFLEWQFRVIGYGELMDSGYYERAIMDIQCRLEVLKSEIYLNSKI